jgi:hypothetical protein
MVGLMMVVVGKGNIIYRSSRVLSRSLDGIKEAFTMIPIGKDQIMFGRLSTA